MIIEQGGMKCPPTCVHQHTKATSSPTHSGPGSSSEPCPSLGLGLPGTHSICTCRDSICTCSPYAHKPPPPPSTPQGYSFVAPSILFDHNNAVMMTDVLEASGAGDRPGRAAVARSAMMQVGGAWVGS